MQHFLTLEHLSKLELETLIEKTLSFEAARIYPSHEAQACATLFYEDSTRTRMSFELAAKRLGMIHLNLDVRVSSVNKGESLLDTVQTIEAMGVDHLIIRHGEHGVLQELLEHVRARTHLINAGEGYRTHPSQALLDLVTIYRHKRQFEALKIVILGDVLHSRVANSLQQGLNLLGVKQIIQVAPKRWQVKASGYCAITEDCDQALIDADVIVCLRVQKERIQSHETLNLERFIGQFQLTKKRLALAKPDVVVMHPGPVNRGVEIESSLVDGANSVILEQVSHGVFARMALLDTLAA